ncbi:succinate dehydrogenase cytochrome b subunit [uncultured Tessaracoccus sp.]|uniref:succinate dehydrogenase cytochrome b subunit n=1 Tax=uncultured Tessaracoccus sp. TaxID=905023 RepID=UPI00345BA5CF
MHQRAGRSTVVKKFTMAVTGLIMIGFLLFHMYGNLKMFIGADAFNHYAHWLKGAEGVEDLMYPILPNGTFIWLFRIFMLLAIILHFWSAITLWQRSAKAAGRGYQHTTRVAQTYSARTMRWGGVIVLLGLIVHLLQFTIMPKAFYGGQPESPYEMVHFAFSQVWFVALYGVWLILVCMHVRHGFWSAFATLGLNLSPRSRAILNGLAVFVAVVLYVGFMIMPFMVLFNVIGG